MTSKIVHHVLPSERSFGYFFSVIFFLLAGWFAWLSNWVWSVIFISVAIAFAILSLASPSTLRPLNWLWYNFGMLLGRIVSPIVLGLLFFVLITPVALIMRLFGRDELKIRRRNVQSCWVDRTPPGPSSDSFKNQF